MFVSVIKRRDGFQIQRGEGLYAVAFDEILPVLSCASLAFCKVAGEQHDNGVEIRTAKAPDPVFGMVGTGCAKDFSSGCHALTKFFGKGRQRRLIDTEGPQTVPGESDSYPPGICFVGSDVFRRSYLIENALQ